MNKTKKILLEKYKNLFLNGKIKLDERDYYNHPCKIFNENDYKIIFTQWGTTTKDETLITLEIGKVGKKRTFITYDFSVKN